MARICCKIAQLISWLEFFLILTFNFDSLEDGKDCCKIAQLISWLEFFLILTFNFDSLEDGKDLLQNSSVDFMARIFPDFNFQL